MKLRALGGLLLLSLVAGTAACEEDGLPLSDYADRAVEVFCQRYVECSGGDDDSVFYLGSVERCLEAAAYFGAEVEGVITAYEAAVDRGTTAYDELLAEECLGYLENAPCDADLPYLLEVAHPQCLKVFDGNVANGGDCHIDLECDVGWCDTQRETVCPGVCAPFTAPGAACVEDSECGPGYECDSETRRCAVRDEQIYGEVGESCLEHPCADGLTCDEDHVCRGRQPAGAACATNRECAAGLLCPEGGGVCTRPTLHAAEGAVCDNEFALCDPLAGLYCDPLSRTCDALPVAGLPCIAERYCALEAWCDGATCRDRKADGAACEERDECRSGYCEGGVCGVSEACFN